MNLEQLSVGKKVALTCGVLVLFSVLIGGLSLYATRGVATGMEQFVSDEFPGLYWAAQTRANSVLIRGNAWKHIASSNKSIMDEIDRENAELNTKIHESLREYEKTVRSPEDRALFSKVGPAYERFWAAWERIRPISLEGKSQEAAAKYLTEATPPFQELLSSLAALFTYKKQSGEKTSVEATAAAGRANIWTWLAMAAMAAIGSLLAVVVIRSLNGTLRGVVGGLKQGAEQLTSAASQVSSSSQALAQGSSEQAASLEQTAASSDEINSMARQNSQNCISAAQLMERSQQRFAETNKALGEMVTAMGEINASSDKISKIIKVIDEIAFQTNILALNAAVEAARAGEAGMGFAVVAEEVRNLAQRCAQAAKDTSTLIAESITKSNEGKAKVGLVNEAVHALTEEVSKTKMLVDEVNLGSQEQARGIEQIAKAISHMQQATQTSAASAEQSASAAQELNSQSGTLNEIIGRLTVVVEGTGAGEVRNIAVKQTKVAPHAPAAHKSKPKASTPVHLEKRVGREMAAAKPKPDLSAFPMDDDFK